MIRSNEYWTEYKLHVEQWFVTVSGYRIMLHRFHGDDTCPVAHAHSYSWLFSIILRGRYVEHIYTYHGPGYGWKRRVEERAWFNFIREKRTPYPNATHGVYHLVKKVFGPVWSIVFTGRNLHETFDYLDIERKTTFPHHYSNPDWPGSKIVSRRLTWGGWVPA